jgi:hypothetical protein
LLLEDLKKMTTYSKHVDLPHTLEALQAMKDLAERINTKKGFSLAIELVRRRVVCVVCVVACSVCRVSCVVSWLIGGVRWRRCRRSCWGCTSRW